MSETDFLITLSSFVDETRNLAPCRRLWMHGQNRPMPEVPRSCGKAITVAVHQTYGRRGHLGAAFLAPTFDRWILPKQPAAVDRTDERNKRSVAPTAYAMTLVP